MTVTVEQSRCVRCGACRAICPTESLAADSGPPRPIGQLCIGCGHCAAVCPVSAIAVAGKAADWAAFETFAMEPEWLPPGQTEVGSLVRLMASRRSCRAFTDRPVDLPVLRDLIRVGVTAPSATNCQLWTFTVLPDRPSVVALVDRCAAAYQRLNRLARVRLLRHLLSWLGFPDLKTYYRRYHEFFERRLAAWKAGGRDFLFHGAPAAIVIGSRPGGSHPAEDGSAAAQNILLAAHAMGLGACLIGMAVAAMRRDPGIARSIGLARDENPHVVVAVGHAAAPFRRMTGRAAPVSRIWRVG